MTELTRPFTPDWVSPPGDTIADLIEERDWTQTQLAERLGYTPKHVSQLINGKASITEETALKLESVLGSTARFWLSREAQYRAQLARTAEAEKLQEWIPWLDLLPVRDLMKQGAIPKRRLDLKQKPFIVKDLLQFFGVASPEEWSGFYASMECAFRRTHKAQSNVGAISAWLRQGEVAAEHLDCPKFSQSKFKKAIQHIRTLTMLPPEAFFPQIQRACWESGVIFALVPPITNAHVSGMARWLNAHKALIQLSLYGKTNDRFWFTFFHEAAHILLHSNKEEIFLDEWDGDGHITSDQEQEADRWARDFLIPPEDAAELETLSSREDIVRFANRIGVHPGIVLGRLQFDGFIEWNTMNDLKVSLSSNSQVTIARFDQEDDLCSNNF